MGSMSLIHWIILGAIVLLLFGGKNKISDVMGDVAKGIKSFKKGLTEEDETKQATRPVEPVRTIDHYPPVQPQPFANQPAQPVPHADTEPRKAG